MITIEAINELSESAYLTEVIHSTPGRLRVRMSWLERYPSLSSDLHQAILGINGVTQAHLNPVINSCTIYYNSEKLSEKTFETLFLQLIQKIIPDTEIVRQQPKLNQTTTQSWELPAQKAISEKIQAVGGRLVGSTVGRTMGFGVGAITGGILLGPLGLIPGAGLGSIVGRSVGSQLGVETVRYFAQESPEETTSETTEINPLEYIQSTIERSGRELVGESVGGVIGAVMGGVVLGPFGSLVGGVLGGAIGSQVAEDWDTQPNE